MLPAFNNPQLLERALTHTSFANEQAQDKLTEQAHLPVAEHNEKLEFLGDAVLDFLSAAWLFGHYPELNEGRLTSLRAAIVRSSTLAQFAEEIDLPDHLRLGKGEVETGGKKSANILGDAFEALLGALYLDQGLEAVRSFITPIFERWAPAILAENLDRDPKSLLQEWSQEELGVTPRYKLVGADGPAHQRIFYVEVWMGEVLGASGSGPSKQSAEQMAAREALRAAQEAKKTEDGGQKTA
ncbi:MAG TPA: ribonuclease III [Thermoflexales bacterium]|nr:ribonuclease III [Thermoflexales bacterium]